MSELPPPPYNQFLVIYDRDGFSRKNFDLELMKKFAKIGDYFPECLLRVFVLVKK